MGLWGDFMLMTESFPQPLRVLLDTNVYGLLATVEPGLVCTQDTKTMASEHAQKAYFAINKKNGLRTPEFILLEDFKKKI